MKNVSVLITFMDTAAVMHEQQSRNIIGSFPNVKYQNGKFSAKCAAILEKVVYSLNCSFNNHYDMTLI
jgi:hypothetical protein